VSKSELKVVRAILLAVLVASQLAAATALAEESDATESEAVAVVAADDAASEIDWYAIGATTLDVAVLRPLGTLSTIGGVAFFVATAPITAPTGGLETSWDVFVYGSYDYTFVRPLGEL
jgi:hypothetical protein